MSGEIVLEGRLELNEGIVRVRTNELFGDENDDTGDSGGKRKHDCRLATDIENEEESYCESCQWTHKLDLKPRCSICELCFQNPHTLPPQKKAMVRSSF